MSDSKPPADLRSLQPKRVCIIKPSALGDVVNALPALEALRARWPGATIAWVVNRSLRGLLDGNPAIDEVIVYDRAGVRFNLGGLALLGRFLLGLRHRRFDLAIDLQGLFRSGLMTAATGARVRVGLADFREGSTRFYTHRIPPPPPESHAVDRLLRVAEAFGAEIAAPRHFVPFAESDRQWARSVLAGVARPLLVLNLGARWITKRWPPEHFAEVARRAVRERGAGLVAIGAPEDAPSVAALVSLLAPLPVLDLCGQTTLPRLAALAAESDVVLSNDTGPLHLAAAVGARVVGIYTCTSPKLNGPYGPRALAVETGVWCKASYLKTCDRLECMPELIPDRVWAAVVAQLDARRAETTTRSAG
jgi:lipopolysaccharide heptosyltransferase II